MRAGVDDFGSGDFKGFSFIALNDEDAEEFERGATALLAETTLIEFHGKEFRVEHAEIFGRFVDSIRRMVEMHDGYAAFALTHRDPYTRVFEKFAASLGDGTLEKLHGMAVPFISDKMGALMQTAHHLSELKDHEGELVALELDWSAPPDVEAAEELVGVAGTRAAILEEASSAAVRVTNAYVSKVFPGGPPLGTLRVCDSKDSLLVQAADVIANFGVNYLKASLRLISGSNSSVTEAAKAELFKRLLPPDALAPPARGLRVTASNELAGAPDDGLRFVLRLV